jgi:hypothetical protein
LPVVTVMKPPRSFGRHSDCRIKTFLSIVLLAELNIGARLIDDEGLPRDKGIIMDSTSSMTQSFKVVL